MTRTLYKNKWVSLKQTSRNFVYAERRNVNSTATLLYKRDGNNYKFLLRYQPLPELQIMEVKKPKWTTLYPCCVTGSMEINETPTQNIVKEVYEETNYIIKPINIIAQSLVVSSTQMNECVYSFVADITHCKKVSKKTGDGTIFEDVSKNTWVSEKRLQSILADQRFPYLSSLASTYWLFLKVIKTTK